MIEFRRTTAAERRATTALPTIDEHMAEHIIDIASIHGNCCEEELERRGFTRGEMRHHGARANRLAIASAERQVD